MFCTTWRASCITAQHTFSACKTAASALQVWFQGFARKLHFTEGLARKLCQEATLHGHTGCVRLPCLTNLHIANDSQYTHSSKQRASKCHMSLKVRSKLLMSS